MHASRKHDRAVDIDRMITATEQVSDAVIATWAEAVDRDGRFPAESIDALRGAGLLSVLVPEELGGPGCDLTVVTEMAAVIASRCASSAMIFAMHQIQVAAIVAHRGCVPEFDDYLRDLVREQRLIASVTSEVGTGGDLRRSLAAVELESGRFVFEKASTTISYCEYADDFLVTLRRSADAAGGDQVLVLVCRGGHVLKDVGVWDTLGMRGTCSPPATISAAGSAWQVLPEPFHSIAPRTMVPVSHILWAGVWLGIATDAFERARRFVQAKARKNEETTGTAAIRLAEMAQRLAGMRARLEMSLQTQDRVARAPDSEAAPGISDSIEINELKVAASEDALAVVEEAMLVIGIGAYRNGGSSSLGRHLRDVHSARLMINNDRIRTTNAELMQVYKGRGRLSGPI